MQRKWVYLEPIFARGTGLPREQQQRFRHIDADFRQTMSEVQRDPRVVSLAGIPGIKSSLSGTLDQLSRCQKALNEYLEEKRALFPRFYFSTLHN